MKNIRFYIIFLLFICCSENKEHDKALLKYENALDSITKLSYSIVLIDSIEDKEKTYRQRGSAIIEKDENDTLFGFSFYAKNEKYDKNYIYINNKSYTTFNNERLYELEDGFYGFLGSPGGQMIYKDILKLDSNYTNFKVEDNANFYALQFYFEDDTTYNIKNQQKIIHIDKKTFLPFKIEEKINKNGVSQIKTRLFKDIRINDLVKDSIADYIAKLSNYKQIKSERPIKISQIGKPFNTISLSNVYTQKNTIIQNKLPLLISFWEPWCSPCIPALTKLKKLQQHYKSKIRIIGISSSNIENTISILNAKKINFQNLIGTKELNNKYNITGFPTYFLVNSEGIIINEYFSFSSEIENDIKQLKNRL